MSIPNPLGAPGPLLRPLTPLIGRAGDVAAIRAWVANDGVRLVTLTGPGGVGKTRLASELVSLLASHFPDGASFVPLGPLRDGSLVLPVIAQSLGVREAAGEPITTRLAATLGRGRQLLVVDNAEHVLPATAAVTIELLVACPNLVVLVTSRQRLALQGEREYPVSPLDVAGTGGAIHTDEHDLPDAMRLLLERAQAVKPDFAVTPENVDIMRRICERLDGLPLAIELAAARIKVLPPGALLERLQHRLPLLAGGGPHLPARQQTMHDTVAWSYDLLTHAEQALFRRLAVFAGGFSLVAAERVVAGPAEDLAIGIGTEAVFDGIASLVEKSLLFPAAEAGQPRFGMLETIRDVALERLQASGEAQTIRNRHLAYALAFAEEHGPVAPAGQPCLRLSQLDSMTTFAAEEDNLRAALEWAIAAADTESAHRLLAPLAGYWMIRGRLRERRDFSARVLSIPGDADTILRAKTLVGLGWAAFSLSQEQAALTATEKGLAICRQHGDDLGMAYALDLLGTLALERGEYTTARMLLWDAREAGDLAADPVMNAWILHHLGALATFEQQFDRAEALLEESLALWRSLGDAFGLGPVLHSVAYVAVERKEEGRAARLFMEALSLWRAVGDELFIPSIFEEVAVRYASGAEAAMLLAAAAKLRTQTGLAIESTFEETFERRCAELRSALGDEGWTDAKAAGEALSLTDAVALAEIWLNRATDEGVGSAPHPFGLSPRESEVLKLVASGLSNHQIAQRLFISLPTVKVHVRAILTKLGLESRTAAAAFAIRNGLV